MTEPAESKLWSWLQSSPGIVLMLTIIGALIAAGVFREKTTSWENNADKRMDRFELRLDKLEERERAISKVLTQLQTTSLHIKERVDSMYDKVITQ